MAFQNRWRSIMACVFPIFNLFFLFRDVKGKWLKEEKAIGGWGPSLLLLCWNGRMKSRPMGVNLPHSIRLQGLPLRGRARGRKPFHFPTFISKYETLSKCFIFKFLFKFFRKICDAPLRILEMKSQQQKCVHWIDDEFN